MKALTTLSSTLALSALVLTMTPQAQAAPGRSASQSQAAPSSPASQSQAAPGRSASQAPAAPSSPTPPAPAAPSSPTPSAPAPSLSCSTGSVTSNPLAGGSSLSYDKCLNPVSGNDVNNGISAPLTAFLNETLGEGWLFDSKFEDGRTTLVPPEFVSSKIEGERSGGQHDGQATTEAWNSRG